MNYIYTNTRLQRCKKCTLFFSVEKLNAISTLLEAFGNSRTVMNTNATRFTQIFSLDFDHSGQIASASVQVSDSGVQLMTNLLLYLISWFVFCYGLYIRYILSQCICNCQSPYKQLLIRLSATGVHAREDSCSETTRRRTKLPHLLPTSVRGRY